MVFDHDHDQKCLGGDMNADDVNGDKVFEHDHDQSCIGYTQNGDKVFWSTNVDKDPEPALTEAQQEAQKEMRSATSEVRMGVTRAS